MRWDKGFKEKEKQRRGAASIVNLVKKRTFKKQKQYHMKLTALLL